MRSSWASTSSLQRASGGAPERSRSAEEKRDHNRNEGGGTEPRDLGAVFGKKLVGPGVRKDQTGKRGDPEQGDRQGEECDQDGLDRTRGLLDARAEDASGAAVCLFAGPLAEGCPAVSGGLVTLLVFTAPVEPLAAARRADVLQTFDARAATIWSWVGAPRSNTTIVTRWTRLPAGVCALIR